MNKRFKYGNHDEVVAFGKKQIIENIGKINHYSPLGDVTVSTRIISGIDIISRLCDVKTKQEFKSLMINSLASQKQDLFNNRQNMNSFYFEKILKQIENIEYVIFNSQLESDNGY